MVYAIPLVLSRILVLVLLVLSSLAATASGKGKIGIDYGLNGDNLLSPERTVALLQSKGVKRVRTFEARPTVTRAFANTGIDLVIGVPNAEVPGLAASAGAAISWVTTNVVPFPTTRISAIIVGNEWLANPANNFSLLVPAIQNIYKALSTLRISNVQLRRIKVSTSHSFSVLSRSYSFGVLSRPSFYPSKAKFSKQYVSVMRPLLSFLRKTRSYFMVNIVPYFLYMEDKSIPLEFVLFEATAGVTDPNTGLHYTNLFDLQLDAVYAAIAALSRSSTSSLSTSSLCSYCNTSSSHDVLEKASKKSSHPKIYVKSGGSGHPSCGTCGSHTAVSQPKENESNMDCGSKRDHVTWTSTIEERHSKLTREPYVEKIVRSELAAATIANAQTFNQNLIRHVLSTKGTPANPTTPIEAYIFEIFNEDLNPPGIQQHFGLFYPNGTAVYPIDFHPRV